jgi:hypothetical protein
MKNFVNRNLGKIYALLCSMYGLSGLVLLGTHHASFQQWGWFWLSTWIVYLVILKNLLRYTGLTTTDGE